MYTPTQPVEHIDPALAFGAEALEKEIEAFNKAVDTLTANREKREEAQAQALEKALTGTATQKEITAYHAATDGTILSDVEEIGLLKRADELQAKSEQARAARKAETEKAMEARREKLKATCEKQGFGDAVLQAMIEEDGEMNALVQNLPAPRSGFGYTGHRVERVKFLSDRIRRMMPATHEAQL